jgi:DNA-binding transcriptional ArsR family regulator
MKVSSERMRGAAGDAAGMLRALSSPHRLMILCELIDGERSVGDLAASLELRQSTVSQHLALLRKDQLVTARRDGQTIWYSIASAAARRILETLYEIYCAPTRICAPRSKKRQSITSRAKA